MSVNYSEELSQAFVVGPDEFKKLVDLLQKHIGKVSISTDCIDKIQRKFTTVKDLIDYENPKSKRICRIYLSARSEDYAKSATIAFRDSSSFSGGVSLSITAREDVVLRLKDKILDIVAGTRRWYNPLTPFDFTSITHWGIYFLFICVVFSLIGFLAFKFGLISDDKEGIELRDQVRGFIIFPSFIFIIMFFTFLSKPFKWLFPSGVFTISQGKSRFETLKWIQRSVAIPFVVSLTAGLVVWIIQVIFA